jgi:hypothetical protein
MPDWGDINPRTRNRNSTKVSDTVDELDLPDGAPGYKRVRAIGPIWSYAGHWFAAIAQTGKEYNTVRLCLNYNAATEEFNQNGCPYCMADPDDEPSINYLGNFIDRALEAAEPMQKPRPQPEEMKPEIIGSPNDPNPFRCLLKTKGSPTWTPVRVWRATSANATKLKNFKEINARVRRDGQRFIFPINHLQYGMDILLKYDSSLSRANQYDIQRDQPSAITEKERKFHMWRLDGMQAEPLEKATKDWNWLRQRLKSTLSQTVIANGGDISGGEAYDASYYGGYDESGLEAPIIASGLAGPLPGTVGKARINGHIVDARLDAISRDGSQFKITLRNGQSGVVSSADFRG